ncbi:hypothetical protein B0J14DRAFT_340927 [Halenospora varia]|nr:hypothetical protein B0J14DRAFT_340927 [Halenospora varia]
MMKRCSLQLGRITRSRKRSGAEIATRWSGNRGIGGIARSDKSSSKPQSSYSISSQDGISGLNETEGKDVKSYTSDEVKKETKKMTIAQQDEELRLKLEGMSGGGGGAGIEYEGGKAVGLKRGVRENMFRVI